MRATALIGASFSSAGSVIFFVDPSKPLSESEGVAWRRAYYRCFERFAGFRRTGLPLSVFVHCRDMSEEAVASF